MYVRYGGTSLVYIHNKPLHSCSVCISDTGLLNISERHKKLFGLYATHISWLACLNSPTFVPRCLPTSCKTGEARNIHALEVAMEHQLAEYITDSTFCLLPHHTTTDSHNFVSGSPSTSHPTSTLSLTQQPIDHKDSLEEYAS
ncbi:hypothetical protein GYMLUDRAFT_614051 [Collybiopsis luxurians FD-317 M1]|uniref:Uncharacterized protein n=1 Tax=Collybiopsis luxurians FD-317 M1 TaxID=944289 RepID=A0A0D0CVU6_9AGAR|nr:hypothetical protein GYMLUDRAFT_614051 [Collybiopsis luxurians FD-317 M1]